MRLREIGDLDIVAEAGSVRRRVIGAEDVEMLTSSEGRLYGDFNEVGSVARRLAGAPLRVGTRYVEIAQHHRANIVRPAGILQHPFHHELAAPIGRHRRE